MNIGFSSTTFSSLIDNKEFNLGETKDYIYEITNSDVSINDIILSDDSREKVKQIIMEHKNSDKLAKFNGLKPINKIMLEGDSGCGKTTTALAIANSLGKGIIIINLTEIISSRLGETSKNLSKAVKYASENDYIIFFDEFDSISKHRTDEKELGEMKRLVNSIIQIMDFQTDDLLIIGATNHLSNIDSAILRRFEEVLHFHIPDYKEIEKYLYMIEYNFSGKVKIIQTETFIKGFIGLDFFKIRNKIFNAVKKKVLQTGDKQIKISQKDLF